MDNQSEISFSSPRINVAVATNFCWLSHGTEFLSFGDICQMAVAQGKLSSARGSLHAGG